MAESKIITNLENIKAEKAAIQTILGSVYDDYYMAITPGMTSAFMDISAWINKLSSDRLDLSGQVDDLTSQRSQLTAQIDQLTAQIAELNGQITEINEKVSEIVDEQPE